MKLHEMHRKCTRATCSTLKIRDTEAKTFVLDMENDILPGCVVHGGAVVHPTIKNLMEGKVKMDVSYLLFILMLSVFGFELINKVPATAHTLSRANAIWAPVVGAVALAGSGNEISRNGSVRAQSRWLASTLWAVHGNRPHAWLL